MFKIKTRFGFNYTAPGSNLNKICQMVLFVIILTTLPAAGHAATTGLEASQDLFFGVRGFQDDGRTGIVPGCPAPSMAGDLVVWPVSGTTSPDPVVSTYGPRDLNGTYDFHAGIDIPPVIPGQTIVHAAMDGLVVRKQLASQCSPSCRFGNWIMLRHADRGDGARRYTTYLHLSAFLVNLGDSVRAGDPIGVMGMSGEGINTEHLHFEYYQNLNSSCGVFLQLSRSAFGLPLPVTAPAQYNVQLGRLADPPFIILRAEIPSERLDVVEYNIITEGATFRVDLDRVDLYEEVGIAPRPCTKCCDKATGPSGNVIQLMPKRFTGDGTYVLCIGVDNADITATYAVTLRNAVGEEMAFGPFTPDDSADVSDCIPSNAPGCPEVGVCRACSGPGE